MKRWYSALLVATAMSVPAAAHAGTLGCLFGSNNPFSAVKVPTVSICINGQFFQSFAFAGIGKPFTLPSTTFQVPGFGSLTIASIINTDPFVSFSFGTTILGGTGPVNIDAFYSSPIVGGPYNNATSSGTFSLSATGANTTGSVTLGLQPAYILGYGDATNLGVNTGTAPCSVSSPNTASCNPPGASNNFAPFSPTTLSGRLNYTQTTTGVGSSSASWTANISLNTRTVTPEPAVFGLVLGGLLLVGATRFRRKRA